jgi:hypothetical protein
MKKTHPALWGAGWAGLFTGTVLLIIGLTDTADVAQMAGGYGLMLIGSAIYLMAGLKLRERLMRRSAVTVITQTAAPTTATAASRS